MVLGNHNLEPSRSTVLLFKFFKFQPLQGWTRFVKFGEIHISTSPKIPPKFRQPSDAMRDHHTIGQLNKNYPHAKIISSNTWPALFLCTFRKVPSCSVIFVRVLALIARAPWRFVHGPFPPGQSTARPLGWTQASVAASIFNAGSLYGGRATRGGQTEPTPARNAVLCRPLLPIPPRGLMHASAPPLHRRRGPTALDALSAANGPAPSRSDQSLP